MMSVELVVTKLSQKLAKPKAAKSKDSTNNKA